jgi:hypothetical protein
MHRGLHHLVASSAASFVHAQLIARQRPGVPIVSMHVAKIIAKLCANYVVMTEIAASKTCVY